MTTPRRLLVASANRGKIAEITQLLADLPVEVVGLDAYPDFAPSEEPYDTFAENAAHKAEEAARHAGCLALADDSGLEVQALGGRPGVFSARYGPDEVARNERLLAELALRPGADRAARFVCVVALASPERLLGTWTGTVAGTITPEPRGTQGFGYDPVFEYEGRTFAEMSREEKGAVSHRGRALQAFRAALPELLYD